MALFDKPLDQLVSYLPERNEPADFDAFWADTLRQQSHPLDARFTPHDAGTHIVTVSDIEFAGYDGHPIRGWYLEPTNLLPNAPCVIHYTGYTIGRGHPSQWMAYPTAGFPTIVMDTRGQGSSTEYSGATPDPAGGTGAEVAGFLTRGIQSREAYYYRRVYVDAVRVIDLALSDARIPSSTVAIAAGSQGAGVGLAVAGLRQDVSVALLDVPSLSMFRLTTEISNVGSRNEISRYLASYRNAIDSVFSVLSYFDVANFAPRATATARFSVALMDQVCPPSTVFAAYNHYAGPKNMRVWPYNAHEGGGAVQLEEHLKFLRDHTTGIRE